MHDELCLSCLTDAVSECEVSVAHEKTLKQVLQMLQYVRAVILCTESGLRPEWSEPHMLGL